MPDFALAGDHVLSQREDKVTSMPPTAPDILRLRSDRTEGTFSEMCVQDPRAR
jgi:hypothetical protein